MVLYCKRFVDRFHPHRPRKSFLLLSSFYDSASLQYIIECSSGDYYKSYNPLKTDWCIRIRCWSKKRNWVAFEKRNNLIRTHTWWIWSFIRLLLMTLIANISQLATIPLKTAYWDTSNIIIFLLMIIRFQHHEFLFCKFIQLELRKSVKSMYSSSIRTIFNLWGFIHQI